MEPEAAMEIPEHLRDIVDRLGQALVEAMTTDEQSRALVLEIQSQGFDMALILEATVALRKRIRDEEALLEDEMTEPGMEFVRHESGGQWSDEDKAFLKTFKISL
jgi:uncharacterized protein (UPF0335 family)